jgi:hypothetical protein
MLRTKIPASASSRFHRAAQGCSQPGSAPDNGGVSRLQGQCPLIPRQYSTGSKTTLLGISKRGNPYLRKMFIHGARAAVLRLKREGSSIGAWMNGLEARAPRNVLIVAMANKLARITWAVLASGEPYRAATLAA